MLVIRCCTSSTSNIAPPLASPAPKKTLFEDIVFPMENPMPKMVAPKHLTTHQETWKNETR